MASNTTSPAATERRARRASLLAVLLGVAVGSAGSAARAEGCDDANVDAQKLERGGKLLDARAKFLECAASNSCAESTKNRCAEKARAVAARIPSVVLEAKRGADALIDVAVTVDGKPLAHKLDGRAIELDPGIHEFVFTTQGDSAHLSVAVVEGRKAQSVAATFTPALPPEPRPESAAPMGAPVVEASRGGARRVAGLVIAGVGVVGVGVGAYLAVTGQSDYKHEFDTGNSGAAFVSKDACVAASSACSSAVSRTRWGIGVAVASGVVAVGGVVLWFTAPSAPTTPRVGVGPNGLMVSGGF